jgi:hypothetical protein
MVIKSCACYYFSKTKLSLGVQVRVFNGAIASFNKSVYTRGLLLTLYYINRQPYVTGNSVIAMKYKDGVIMACDTGG